MSIDFGVEFRTEMSSLDASDPEPDWKLKVERCGCAGMDNGVGALKVKLDLPVSLKPDPNLEVVSTQCCTS